MGKTRVYPALDISWPAPPDDEQVDRLLADVDHEALLGVEMGTGRVRLFFNDTVSRGRVAQHLTRAMPGADCAEVDVPDDDWAARSQASLPPVRVGRLMIVTEAGGDANLAAFARDGVRHCLSIVPSMGFGTGHHATTRLCLRLLQDVPIAGARVLDIGTGSGILAIAARMLGSGDVVAIDTDADALDAARENVERNGVVGRIDLRLADLTQLSTSSLGVPFDLVLANLTGALLVNSARTLAGLMRPSAHVIASGFMTEDEAAVRRAFEAGGYGVVTRAIEDDWISLQLRRIR